MPIDRLAILALSLVLLVGCAPWYRDAENRGRRAADPKEWTRLSAALDAAEKAHDHARAAALARELVLAEHVWLPAKAWAIYARLADRPVIGRAALCYRLARPTPKPSGTDLYDPEHRFIVDAYLGETMLRGLLVRSYLDEERVADALAATGMKDLTDARKEYPALAEHEAINFAHAAMVASANDPLNAARLQASFIEAYGIPDHAFLVAADEKARAAVWAAATSGAPALAALVELLPRADEALAAGDATVALALYSLAWRKLPRSVLASHDDSLERAALAAHANEDPATANPIAYGLAVEGDMAARAGKLGEAQRAYRRAIAEAPWWKGARDNLALLRAIRSSTGCNEDGTVRIPPEGVKIPLAPAEALTAAVERAEQVSESAEAAPAVASGGLRGHLLFATGVGRIVDRPDMGTVIDARMSLFGRKSVLAFDPNLHLAFGTHRGVLYDFGMRLGLVFGDRTWGGLLGGIAMRGISGGPDAVGLDVYTRAVLSKPLSGPYRLRLWLDFHWVATFIDRPAPMPGEFTPFEVELGGTAAISRRRLVLGVEARELGDATAVILLFGAALDVGE